jgi:hypothetical protein
MDQLVGLSRLYLFAEPRQEKWLPKLNQVYREQNLSPELLLSTVVSSSEHAIWWYAHQS